jgi:hypothetical protein
VNDVFLDTSIQIARFVHSPASKHRIETQLRNYDALMSGLVVKQEFKRRLLKEAQYLLSLVKRYGSYKQVNRHVVDVLPQQQARKRNICLEMIATIFETEGDEDLTDRLRLFLRSLLLDGLDGFDSTISHLVERSNCGCARFSVREKRPFEKYDFGTDKCSQVPECGIKEFLASRKELLQKILGSIKSLDAEKKTPELLNAEKFIENFLERPDTARSSEPCLTLGDLLIALESAGITTFYTMNGRESQHLCKALGQDLVVRPRNPDHDDVVCPAGESWPEF